ncbi:MAG: Gfo/Idh/MocA family oxidoreductase [Saprospiraceae bacterium]|nr:Gfo/Idh/MocA family oxidoreductase [Saprospiraceae bacterium]
MYSKIKVAVVGTGFIGPVHVEALRRLGIHVKGILGSRKEKTIAATRRLGLEKVYHDYEDVLSDPEIQAVHIATPNVTHYSMSRQALSAGKHVMCEKPLATSAKETGELVDQARQSGLVAGVTYNVRFYPMNLEAKNLINKGDIGEIFSVTGSYVQDWLLYNTDYNWRVQAEKGGALRAVADIGTHWMDLVHHVTGLQPEAVYAHLGTVHKQRIKPLGEVQTFTAKEERLFDTEIVNIDTEDCGSILFKYKQGGQGQLWVSQVMAGFKNRIRYEISGSEKSLSWDSDRANQLQIGHRNQANEVLEKDPALVSRSTARFIDYPGGHAEGFPDTFKQSFRAFYDTILNGGIVGENHYATFADGHQEAQLCDSILESHLKNTWVYLHD